MSTKYTWVASWCSFRFTSQMHLSWCLTLERGNSGVKYQTYVLSQYDMTVMDYPLQNESCPLLPLEMIHHFQRSSESWLSLEGQQNVLLMHCERGGWPVLAFMLSGLLLYRKQYHGEQKTLEMVHKHAASSSVVSSKPAAISTQITSVHFQKKFRL